MSSEYEPGLVSVIIPTYNRAHRIVETLDSVHAQTYRPIEVIVVDDGSTDDTADVFAGWRAGHLSDPAFRAAFFRQENRGAPAARNRGAIESHGEYLHFWDCEDLMHPEKIEKQVAAAGMHQADIVVCDVGFFEHEPGDMETLFKYGTRIDNCRAVTDATDAWMLTSGWGTLAVLFRRSVACSAGPWRETLSRSDDFEFTFRASVWAKDYAGLGETLSFARVHTEPGCVSNRFCVDSFRSMMEAHDVIRENLVRLDRMGPMTQLFLHCNFTQMMNEAVKAGHRDVALKACRAALELAPANRHFRRIVLRLYLAIIRRFSGRTLRGFNKMVNSINSVAHAARIKRPVFQPDVSDRLSAEPASPLPRERAGHKTQ